VLVCNAVRAAIDEIDGFTSSLGELGISNVSGYALQELVYKPRRLRVVVNATTAVSVVSQTVESMSPVHGRAVGFNPVTDQPLLRLGNGWVDPMKTVAGQPLHKFLYHIGYGDGQARQRGYGFCGHYLYFLTGLGVNRFSVVAETYGVNTPYLLVPDGEVQPEEFVLADNFLKNLGKGKPAYLDSRWGKLEQTETPSGLVPIWQALLGYLDAQKAQLVVSNTLSQEMGGVGSYNAASTHADQQLATQRIDCSLIAGTLRSQLLRYILQLNARVWAAAFSPYVGGCSPADIIACCPQMKIEVKPELTQVERLKMFIDAEQHGWKVDEDQVRAECSLHAPMAADPAPAAAPPAPDAAPTTPTPPQRPLFRELSAAPLPTDLCVMLPLPSATAQAIAIPGYEEADDLHITLAFAAGIPETATAQVAVALAQTASLWPAVRATIGGKLQTFQTEDGGVVLWAPVVSDDLAQLRNTIVDIVTAAGCEVSDKDFVPHVSLAFLTTPDVPATECDAVSVVLDEIAMNTSDGENFNEPSVFALAGSIT
jgi:2'-5' RNA ligase